MNIELIKKENEIILLFYFLLLDEKLNFNLKTKQNYMRYT